MAATQTVRTTSQASSIGPHPTPAEMLATIHDLHAACLAQDMKEEAFLLALVRRALEERSARSG